MDVLGQLAGGVAHDFNNAAAVVLAGLSLLQKRHGAALDGLGPEVVRLLAGKMEQAAERGGSVAHRLLAFARHEELSATAIDPVALLSSLYEVLSSTLEAGVRVRAEQVDGLPALYADRQQRETP